jgi:signal transduction histidine kinase
VFTGFTHTRQRMNYLHPGNWSKYSRRYSGDKEALRQHKRIILLSQFTLFGAVAGVLHALEDLVDGLVFMPMMDSIMALSIFLCYLLNENGRHRLARITLLTFLNLFFFVYSSLAHRDLGIYLFYFSWVGLAAVVFERQENFLRFFFIGLSILLTIILFASDFSLFGEVPFPAIDLARSFIINFVTSIVVLVFFIIFMVNINEQSELRLVELASEVQQRNSDLEKANRELDRFFYSTSHDLKVPLLDIKGAINSAVTEFDDEKVLAYFEVLKERADKLDLFLQDIIDYARNSQTGLKLEPVNITHVIESVIDNFTFVKGADKINFIKEIEVQHEIESDRIRLIIVLNNILSNSIKYHRTDNVSRWIKVKAQYSQDNLVVSVSDNGSGIEDDLQQKIFDMFFRGTNQSRGSGLGLYIVKEIVGRMNGSISVKSKVGVGSEFVMTIPCLPGPGVAIRGQLKKPKIWI